MIDIFNLTKLYSSTVLALDNISLSVKKGDFFALLGKNGAGKSTAIGILTSLIRKDFGKVYVAGYDLDIDLLKIKSLIGFVPQEFNFSQFENVLDIVLNQAGFYGIKRSFAFKKAKCFLKYFNLWDKRNFVSMSLSGGMKRRLMIVRALLHDPKILILDEPTAGVDIISRHLIWKFLIDFNKSGKTIILTTHYLEEVENLCNNVAIIDYGSILLNINVKDFLNRVSKQTFLLEVNDSNLFDKLDCKDITFIKKNKNLIEVVFLKKGFNLNKFFSFILNSSITVYSIKSKHNKFEELFINLVR